MDYEKILRRCNELMWSTSLDEIDNFLPELMWAYDMLDLDNTREIDWYELCRDNEYIRMSNEKADTKKTDKLIDAETRKIAKEKYPLMNEHKCIARHLNMYINQLESRKIKLMSDRKQWDLSFN